MQIDLTDHSCTLPSLYPPDLGHVFQCHVCATQYVAVQDGRKTTPVWVRKDDIPTEAPPLPTRVELWPVALGTHEMLALDMGQDAAIVIQPKPDQKDGELGLNIVFGGGLTVEVVAWMLGQASEAMVNGIREQYARLEVGK